ncbi:protein Abitram [Uranotaenia lowii]|uniref:protein Abitram n=1 Tax=Uranotaenia lowii TaxID=190385 RepID=UPI0024793A13|nr:protein Abitram [Uranotaenia lowii]
MTATALESYLLKEEPQTICGKQVSSIVEDYFPNFPSIVDRFYTRYYYIQSGKDSEPHQILFHSNRICLVGLAPGHEAFARGIESISFEVGKIDRSRNQVSGKKKAGGMIIQADSTLALLTCKDGSVFKIRGCVQGKLVEVNQRVIKDIDRLAVEGEGFIAIVMPKPEQCEAIKAKLLTKEQLLITKK